MSVKVVAERTHRIDSVSGLQQMVRTVQVRFDMIDDDTEKIQASVVRTVALPPPDPDNYIEWSDVTREQVAQWAADAIGAWGIKMIELDLLRQKREKSKNPESWLDRTGPEPWELLNSEPEDASDSSSEEPNVST